MREGVLIFGGSPYTEGRYGSFKGTAKSRYEVCQKQI